MSVPAAHGESLTELAQLAPAFGQDEEWFGRSVAASGDLITVGAYYNSLRGQFAGSVYIFEQLGASWREQALVLPDDIAAKDFFGYSVAMEGDYFIAGSYQDDDLALNSGAAYVFRRNGDHWVQQAKLKAADASIEAQFGYSVDISGDRVIVGAQHDYEAGWWAGAAYVFKQQGDQWVQEAKLIGVDTDNQDWLGYSVSIDGDYAAVGAYGHATQRGAVYVFYRRNGVWTQHTKLMAADGVGGDRFGNAVDLSGSRLAVGAYYASDIAEWAGSVYLFRRKADDWVQWAELVADDVDAFDQFGYSISMNDDYLVVGANLDSDQGTDAGSAYLFRRMGENWVQDRKLTASNAANADQFGVSVGISGRSIVIGAQFNDIAAVDGGAAYIHTVSNPDHDRDGDVDLADFAIMAGCTTGSVGQNETVDRPRDCTQSSFGSSDFDGDQDVDASDFEFFHTLYTGPHQFTPAQ